MTEFTFGQLGELYRNGMLDSSGLSLFADARSISFTEKQASVDHEATQLTGAGFAAVAGGVTHAVCIDLRTHGDASAKPLVSTFFTDGIDGFFAEPFEAGWRISEVVSASRLAMAIASFTSQGINHDPEFILLDLADAMALFRAARELPSDNAAVDGEDETRAGSNEVDLDKLVVGQRLSVVRRGIRETAVSSGASNLAILATGSIGFVGEPGSMYVCSAETAEGVVFQQVDVEVAASLLSAVFEPIQLPPMLPVSIAAGSIEMEVSTMHDPANRPGQVLTFGPVALRDVAGRVSDEEPIGWESAVFRPEFVISWSTREAADFDGGVSISGDSEFAALRAFSSDGMLAEIRPVDELPGMLHRAMSAAHSPNNDPSDASHPIELVGGSLEELVNRIEKLSERVGVGETTITHVSCRRMASDGLIHGEQFEVVWLSDVPTSYIDQQADEFVARAFDIDEITSRLLHTLNAAPQI